MGGGGTDNVVYLVSVSDFTIDEGETNLTYTETNSLYFKSTLQTDGIERYNHSDNLNISGIKNAYYPPEMIDFAAISIIVLAAIAIVGNFISIWALSKSRRLKRITTVFVVNLCVADFLQSYCNLTKAVLVYRTQHWNGGDETCKFYNILIFFLAAVSITTVITIALNRYILIVHPQWYQVVFRLRNTAIMIGSLWTVSMVLTLLPHFKVWGKYGYDPSTGECIITDRYGKTEIYIFVLAYIVPLILFILCYAKIFCVVRTAERNSKRHRGNILSYIAHVNDKYWHEETEKESARRNYKHLHNRKELRLFQIILVIFLCYILCFIPLSLMKILRKEKEHPKLYIFSYLGIHLSNVVNPVIYIVMSEEYRKAYKELFQCNRENS